MSTACGLPGLLPSPVGAVGGAQSGRGRSAAGGLEVLRGELLQQAQMFNDDGGQGGWEVGGVVGIGTLFQGRSAGTQRTGADHVTGAFEAMCTTLNGVNVTFAHFGFKLLQVGGQRIKELLQNFTPQRVVIAQVFQQYTVVDGWRRGRLFGQVQGFGHGLIGGE